MDQLTAFSDGMFSSDVEDQVLASFSGGQFGSAAAIVASVAVSSSYVGGGSSSSIGFDAWLAPWNLTPGIIQAPPGQSAEDLAAKLARSLHREEHLEARIQTLEGWLEDAQASGATYEEAQAAYNEARAAYEEATRASETSREGYDAATASYDAATQAYLASKQSLDGLMVEVRRAKTTILMVVVVCAAIWWLSYTSRHNRAITHH